MGGYRPLALMEDLDLVERLSKVAPPFIELLAHQRGALAVAGVLMHLAQCPTALALAAGPINGQLLRIYRR